MAIVSVEVCGVEVDQSSWLTVVRIVVSLLTSLDVLLHKRRPVSAVLWLGIIWSFAWVGAIVYFVFGIDRVRWLGSEQQEPDVLDPAVRALLPDHAGRPPEVVTKETPGAHVLRITEPAVTSFAVTGGNTVELLVDGDAFYPALLEAIAEARHAVHVQSFIISRDDSGREILEALRARAADGLDVRLLYDRFGSTLAHFTGFFRPARRAGAQVRSKRSWGHLNLRNHRKVAVLDGKIAFVGGLNIDDRNVTGRARHAPDRDYHVRLMGPAVGDLQLQFLSDWASATRTSLEKVITPDLFPPLSETGSALVQVVPGGPEGSERGLAKAYFGAVAAAADSVTIVTPYFLPDDAIFEALRYSALRGVAVQIILPKRSNHWPTAPAARTIYGPLLRAGVRIFERAPPFMHAKALVVDGVYSMLGSANLDYRSLHLNFELNIEVVDVEFAARVAAQIASEIAQSREIRLADHVNRGIGSRVLERFCRLLQPVL